LAVLVGCGSSGGSSGSNNGSPLSSFTTDSDIRLRVGDNVTVEIQGTYEDGSSKTLDNKDVSFTINDTTIASVDSSGKVTALSEGNTTLKITYPKLNSITLDVVVTKELNTSNINKAYFGSLYLANIPKDSTIEKYDERLFAMISGRVSDESGNPLKDAIVSIHKQREYGTTRTDENGSFAMPVEGGQNIIVRFKKSGFTTIDREIFPKVQDWTIVPEITLLAKDNKYSKIDMNSSLPRIHSSNKIRDNRGERATTLVFERKNEAKAVKEDGSERTLESINVRATEFKTPESMPANLPDTVAYTYCADITVDGVGDDESVVFDEPIVMYVDNFLNFDVGTIVPVGYYDRNSGKWVGSENGVIVKLLDTDSDGKVDALDSTGDGQPDDLNGDGSYSDEVAGIQDNSEYEAGKTYMRGKILHLTPWDLNYGWTAPSDTNSPPPVSVEGDGDGCDVPTNSYITSKTQVLHEDIDVAGTDLRLHYSSKESEGYKHIISATIDTTNMSASAFGADVILEIAGKQYTQDLNRGEVKNVEFEWDGKDAVGNKLSGIIEGTLTVRYKYHMVYNAYIGSNTAWAQIGTNPTGIEGIDNIAYQSIQNVTIDLGSRTDYKNSIANGWSLEDDLYFNLSTKGVLINAEQQKYIEVKDGLLFAVDNEPKNRLTAVTFSKDKYYSLMVYDYTNIALATFDFQGYPNYYSAYNSHHISYEYKIIGTFSEFGVYEGGVNTPPYLYDDLAYYRGTIFEGLPENYGDLSHPKELKEKIRDRINNNQSYHYIATLPSAFNAFNNFWATLPPTELLYQRVSDALVPEYDYTLNANSLFVPLDLTDGNIVIFNQNLGYVYDISIGLLTKIFDNTRKQVIREYEHDSDGRLVGITDQFNNKVTITRDYDGKPTQITAPNGQKTELLVNQNGDLTSVTYEDSSNYQFSYDDKSLLTSKQTPNNYYSKYYYDKNGRISEQTDTNNGKWQFSKTQLTNATEYNIIKPEGDKVTYVDTRAFDESISSLIKLPSGYTYTANSNKGESDINTSRDSVQTRTTTTKDPLTLNTILQSQSVKMPSGLTKTTTQSITYSGDVKDPSLQNTNIVTNSKTTNILTDYKAGTVTAQTPVGRKFVETYDLSTGLATKTQYANLLPITYEYDTKGRLTKQAQGTNQVSYTYNSKGNAQSITDAKGLKTLYEYDSLDRVTSVTYPNDNKEHYAYDNEGNVLKYTTPKKTEFDFEFNPLSQRTSLKSPNSKTTLYSYNKNRDLTTITNPSGKKVNYTYTSSQLSRVSTPEANYDYTYLFDDKIKTIVTGSESVNYEYDGVLLTKINYQGALSQDISFAYNSDFNLASTTYAGKSDTYTYDLDNLLSKSGSFSIQRDTQAGLVTQISDGTFTKQYSYDNTGYISKIQDNNYTEQITSRYDNSNIKEISEGSNTYAYEYDNLNRLTKVTKNNQAVEQYTYDAQGNRISSTLNSVTTTASYNNDDELTTYGANSYTYDTDGYLKTKTDQTGTTTYTYGTLGELKTVSLSNGTTISYAYNANNQRVSKSVNNQITEKYLWLNLTTLLAVYDGNNNLKQRFVYADSRTPVAYTDNSNNIFYLSYNHLGTLKAVTDQSNNILKQLEYDSFGNILSDTNPTLDIHIGFAGGLYDKDTKLTRFGHRDYDSYTGRWTAKDPIDFSGGDSNLYGYVLGDPVNFVDIYGLSVWGVIWNVITCGKSAKDAAGHVSNANDLKEQCERLNQDNATNSNPLDRLWNTIPYNNCRYENFGGIAYETGEAAKSGLGIVNKGTNIGNKGVKVVR
jgi:RHS repeat-associated protein